LYVIVSKEISTGVTTTLCDGYASVAPSFFIVAVSFARKKVAPGLASAALIQETPSGEFERPLHNSAVARGGIAYRRD